MSGRRLVIILQAYVVAGLKRIVSDRKVTVPTRLLGVKASAAWRDGNVSGERFEIADLRFQMGIRNRGQPSLRDSVLFAWAAPALRCTCLAGRRAACRANYNRRSAAESTGQDRGTS